MTEVVDFITIDEDDIDQKKVADYMLEEGSDLSVFCRVITEGTLAGMIISGADQNADWPILAVNPAGRKMLGYRASSDIIGQSYLSLVPAIYHQWLVAVQAPKFYKDGSTGYHEVKFIRSDGTFMPVTKCAMLITKNGQPHVACEIFYDNSKVDDLGSEIHGLRNKLQREVCKRLTRNQES